LGKQAARIEEASFVPSSPLILGEFLQKWETYIGFDDSDFLLQTTVIHHYSNCFTF